MNSSSTYFSSSTTPIKPPPMPQGSDENDENFQETRKQGKIPNKQTETMKHFMTPTISAASKVNPSVKKVLAERNETVGTHQQKTTTSAGEFVENKQNALDDLSSKPYSPLTKYLSPRPKFVRYNPNRRREIFLQRENEKLAEGECGLGVVRSGSLDSAHGSVEGDLGSSYDTTVDGNMVQESDEEFEEEMEERGWGFKTVLKYLFLMAALVLSTTYISSMNSPEPSPIAQAVMGLNDGYHMVQDNVYGLVTSLRSGSYLLLESEEMELGFRDTTDSIEEEIEDVVRAEAETSDEVYDVMEAQSKAALGLVEAEMTEEVNEFGESNGIVGQNGGNDASINVEIEKGEDIREDKQMEAFDELSNAVKLESGETATFVEHEEVEREDSCDQLAEDPELESTKAVEVSETQLLIDVADHHDLVSAADPSSFDKEKDVSNESLMEETVDVERVYDEQPKQEDYADDIDQGSPSEVGLTLKYMEVEPILKVFIGFVIVSSFVSPLALAFHSKRKKRSRMDTSPILERCFESVTSKKSKSAIAGNEPPLVLSANLKSVIPEKDTSAIENGKAEHIRLLDSKFLNNSVVEDTAEQQSFAPSIEFLGEFEVEEMSSCLRSCSLKSKTMIDGEVSSHCNVSTKKAETFSKEESMVHHLHPDVSGISTPNSASSRRPAVEKKIVKKKEKSTDCDLR